MAGDSYAQRRRWYLRLACRDWSGTNEALGVCSRDATINRLIVDSVDHGVRQQYRDALIFIISLLRQLAASSPLLTHMPKSDKGERSIVRREHSAQNVLEARVGAKVVPPMSDPSFGRELRRNQRLPAVARRYKRESDPILTWPMLALGLDCARGNREWAYRRELAITPSNKAGFPVKTPGNFRISEPEPENLGCNWQSSRLLKAIRKRGIRRELHWKLCCSRRRPRNWQWD